MKIATLTFVTHIFFFQNYTYKAVMVGCFFWAMGRMLSHEFKSIRAGYAILGLKLAQSDFLLTGIQKQE